MATYTVTDSLSLKLQPKTPKSALLEFYQAQGQAQAQGIHPSQVLFNVLRTGPDHAPLFACKLELPSVGWLTPQVVEAQGRTKKSAEHEAARKALDILTAAGLLLGRRATSVAPTPSFQELAPAQGVRMLQLLPAAVQQTAPAEAPQELQDLPLPVHEERAFQSVAGLTLEHAADPFVAQFLGGIDVDSLTEDRSKRELLRALHELHSVRQELLNEQGRKNFAVEALLNTGNGAAAYASYASSHLR